MPRNSDFTSDMIRRINTVALSDLDPWRSLLVLSVERDRKAEKRLREWERRHQEHERRVHDEPALRSTARPQEADASWVLIPYSGVCEPGDGNSSCHWHAKVHGGDDRAWDAFGWTPPELLPEAKPVVPVNLFTDAGQYQEADLAGKVLALTCFHDRWGPQFSENIRPINPWGLSGVRPMPGWTKDRVADHRNNLIFMTMRRCENLLPWQIARLSEALNDVEREFVGTSSVKMDHRSVQATKAPAPSDPPSLFDLLDGLFPKLVEWEAQYERDVDRIGAGIALRRLPVWLKSEDPPEFVLLARRKKKVKYLRETLKCLHDGELTRASLKQTSPFIAPVPSYFRSEVNEVLLAEQPGYFSIRDAWQVIVRGIATRFTIEWTGSSSTYLEMDGSCNAFETDLRSYQHARQHDGLDVPDEFSAELAKLNDKGVGGEIFAELKSKFPAIADELKLDDNPTSERDHVAERTRRESQVTGGRPRIKKVALSVHQHTFDSRKLERYRQEINGWTQRMAVGWTTESLRAAIRREHPDWTVDQVNQELASIRKHEHELGRIVTERSSLGIGITTDAATPLDQQYATMAAIHDRFCECENGMELWLANDSWKDPNVEGATEEDWDELSRAMFYKALVEDVDSLTEADRSGIERMLESVSADLVDHLVESNSSGHKSGVNDADSEVVETHAINEERKDQPRYYFRLVGAIWELRYGEEQGKFPKSKGLRTIHRLLQSPGENVLATELHGIDTKKFTPDQTVQEVSDHAALSDYRTHLADVDSELAEAKRNSDEAAISRLSEEREQVTHAIRQSLGLAGRSRSLGSRSKQDAARVAVRRNLDRAIKTLREIRPPMSNLANHLHRNIKCDGITFVYQPEECPEWELAREIIS